MGRITLLITGLVLLYVTMDVASEDICPGCTCPVERSPVCGKQEVTEKLRGFSSICVMNCTNQCRKNKFVFYKKGRCGSKPKNPMLRFLEPQPRPRYP